MQNFRRFQLGYLCSIQIWKAVRGCSEVFGFSHKPPPLDQIKSRKASHSKLSVCLQLNQDVTNLVTKCLRRIIKFQEGNTILQRHSIETSHLSNTQYHNLCLKLIKLCFCFHLNQFKIQKILIKLRGVFERDD